MKKRGLLLIVLALMATLFSTRTVYAHQKNYFVWDKDEIDIPINSNFESYISQFHVKFFYEDHYLTSNVHVELDPFYYGSHTILTNKVETKEVILLAYVQGYSNYERKAVLIHVKDDIKPEIKCKKELNICVNEPFEPSKYFLFTDNDLIDESTIDYEYKSADLKILGSHDIFVRVADINGNMSERKFTYYVYDDEEPRLSVASKIEIEYGNINYDIRDYVKAIDNFDGDITNSVISTDIDVFRLGDQNITISVTDSNGNLTKVEKTISIVDLSAPTLELSTYHDTIVIDNLDKIDFKGYISKVYDFGSNLSVDDVYIDTKDFTKNIGQNVVYYYLKDNAGNYTKRELLIDIRYADGPIITCNDLTFEQNQTFDLKDYIKVYSEYDPNVEYSFQIDELVLDRSNPGVYEVLISAMDYAGNETKKSIFVTITNNEKSNENIIKKVYATIFEKRYLIGIVAIGFGIFLIFHFNKKHKKLGE